AAPVVDEGGAVHRPEAGGPVVAGPAREARHAGHAVAAARHVVEDGGAGAAVLGGRHLVEDRVGVALPRARLLDDDGHGAGERGRRGGGPAHGAEPGRAGGVALEDQVAVVAGRGQGDVGHVALAVAGDAGSRLPGGLGEAVAGAAAGGPQAGAPGDAAALV